MIVTCPECHARYTIADHVLQPAGRSLKCNKCSHQWHQNPPLGTDPLVEEQGATPPMPAMPRPENVTVEQEVAAHNKQISKQRLVMGAAIAAGVVVVGAIGAWVFWPSAEGGENKAQPSEVVVQKKDAKIDADVPAGFSLSNVERQVVEQERMNIVLFKGDITNTSKLQQPTPEIMVTLLSASGRVVDYWPAQVDATYLEPGQTLPWVCRFFNPPLAEVVDYKINIKPQE